MKSLPENASPYRRTPVFTEGTVPAGLLQAHSTKPGVWGAIRVTSGRLRYTLSESGEVFELAAGLPGIIEPEAEHFVTPVGPVTFFVEFLRVP